MNKKLEITKAFNLPVEIDTLEEMKETHTYISDKLILDVVNGVNVVARDFNEKNKSRQSFLPRTVDSIFGSTRKRQDLINENLIEGVQACTKWLNDHDEHISRIDKRIGDIAKELIRTQDEILKFYGQHSKLKNRVNDLEETFINFTKYTDEYFTYLDSRINEIDIRTKAINLIDDEFSKLSANKYNHLSIPFQIYTVLDNIKSGYGGIYYDLIKDEKEKREFQEKIENKCIIYLKDKCDLKDYIDYEKELLILPDVEKEAISFISTQHYNDMLKNNIYPEVSDLVSISSSFEKDKIIEEIEKQSNIRTFFTYEEYLKNALDEHLKI